MDDSDVIEEEELHHRMDEAKKQFSANQSLFSMICDNVCVAFPSSHHL